MSKPDLLIKEAYRSFSRKKYGESTAILEGIVSLRPDDPYPYFLLALGYLLTDRLSKLDELLKRIKYVDPHYRPLAHLELFIYLKSSLNRDSTLAKYFEYYNKFPDDRTIYKAIGRLKSCNDFITLQKNAVVKDYIKIPKPGSRSKPKTKKGKAFLKKRRRMKFLVMLVPICVIIFMIIVFINKINITENIFFLKHKYLMKNKNIGAVEKINLDSVRYQLIDGISVKKTPFFYYSADEIKSDFNKARYLLKEDKVNEALLIINRIRYSNASMNVKEKVDFLKRYADGIENREVYIVSIKDVKNQPYRYPGIRVQWEGKIANMRTGKHSTVFDFMADYKKGGEFSGIAVVYSEKISEKIENGKYITVQAEIMEPASEHSAVHIKAVKIRVIEE